MNARCFGSEMADIVRGASFIGADLSSYTYEKTGGDFGYKKSPFQPGEQCENSVITEVEFELSEEMDFATDATAARNRIHERVEKYRAEREAKGQYKYPSAGSVFKNNRAFGKPTGQIIQELGLCGTQRGGAQIAPWHGNFIVNTGGAKSSDVMELINLCKDTARAKLGIELECEVIPVK
jgi:UDP-N-acetylmuramate dehydrogenase